MSSGVDWRWRHMFGNTPVSRLFFKIPVPTGRKAWRAAARREKPLKCSLRNKADVTSHSAILGDMDLSNWACNEEDDSVIKHSRITILIIEHPERSQWHYDIVDRKAAFLQYPLLMALLSISVIIRFWQPPHQENFVFYPSPFFA